MNNDDTLRRLQGLLAYTREGLDVELKGWLDLLSEDDKAKIAQTIHSVPFGFAFVERVVEVGYLVVG